MSAPGEITALLERFADGDPDAFDRLVPLVYEELLELARGHRHRWGADPGAPGTTSLVHEAYLKLARQDHVEWESRAQFYAVASRVVRSVLVDSARRRSRAKRGGGQAPVPLADVEIASPERSDDLVALDEALRRLEAEDERLARIVECRFFAGLTVDQTAEALAVSPSTVKRGWSLARTWLFRELGDPDDGAKEPEG